MQILLRRRNLFAEEIHFDRKERPMVRYESRVGINAIPTNTCTKNCHRAVWFSSSNPVAFIHLIFYLTFVPSLN